jgi:hypothetical protein
VRFVIPVHLSQRAAAYEFEPIVGVLLQVDAFHLAQRQGVQQIAVQSSSATRTVSQTQTFGRQVAYFLNGREVGETVTVTLAMRDGVGNIKNDTIKFVCVAP